MYAEKHYLKVHRLFLLFLILILSIYVVKCVGPGVGSQALAWRHSSHMSRWAANSESSCTHCFTWRRIINQQQRQHTMLLQTWTNQTLPLSPWYPTTQHIIAHFLYRRYEYGSSLFTCIISHNMFYSSVPFVCDNSLEPSLISKSAGKVQLTKFSFWPGLGWMTDSWQKVIMASGHSEISAQMPLFARPVIFRRLWCTNTDFKATNMLLNSLIHFKASSSIPFFRYPALCQPMIGFQDSKIMYKYSVYWSIHLSSFFEC